MDNNNMFNDGVQNYQAQQPQEQQYQQQQYQQQYQSYQQPYQQQYQSYQPNDMEEPVSVGEWLLTYLVMLIPCVNIVMMFVWAFGNGAKKSKANYFKSILILYAIVLAIVLVAYIILFAVLGLSLAELG